VVNPFSPEALDYYRRVGEQEKADPLGAPLRVSANADLQFANQRQAAEDVYGQQSANNAYGRATTAADYIRRLRDFNFQQDKFREGLPGRFNRRGMLGSGVWQHGLKDYALLRARQGGDLQEQRARALGQYDVNEQMLLKQKLFALAQLEAQRQMMMNQMAAQRIGGGGQ